jgi:hypothetical protein
MTTTLNAFFFMTTCISVFVNIVIYTYWKRSVAREESWYINFNKVHKHYRTEYEYNRQLEKELVQLRQTLMR